MVCALFGVTRQAYYDAIQHAEKATIANMVVLAGKRNTDAEANVGNKKTNVRAGTKVS